MRTLIIDDDEDMRELVKLTMELAGDEVVAEAASACGGAQRWDEARPDVVICDYRMPDHSGLDLAAHILEKDPTARIVLFSAYLDDETVAKADALGVLAVSKDLLTQLPQLARAA